MSEQTDQLLPVDPSRIYFTFARIRGCFSCGRSILSDTLQQIIDGKLNVTDLPTILVLRDEANNMFSMNNRRLFLFKELQKRGLLSTVVARVRAVPNTQRMKDKYSIATCKLEAKLMPHRKAEGGNDQQQQQQQQPEQPSGDDDDDGDQKRDGEADNDTDDDGVPTTTRNAAPRVPAPAAKSAPSAAPKKGSAPTTKAQQQQQQQQVLVHKKNSVHQEEAASSSKISSLESELAMLKQKSKGNASISSSEDDENETPKFQASKRKRK